eukprot:572580-Lingulodinium_polyedra.AAC.1
MMRSSQRFTAAAARQLHVCALHALTGLRSARGAHERAVCEAHRQHTSSTQATPKQHPSSI